MILSQNYERYQIIPIVEHFVTYKLRTPKSRLLQELIVAQLVQKLSASYETQTFVTSCRRAPHLCLFSQFNSIQSAAFNSICLYVGPVFPSCLFPSVLATEVSYTSLPCLLHVLRTT